MKQWSIAKLNTDTASDLAQQCSVPPFLAMLLAMRGFDTAEKIQAFLSDEPLIDDPFEIKDMDKAAERIITAIEKFEKICVYGDYDADGVTSTALLYSYLQTADANVMYYIPSRAEEGYGLNNGALDYLKEQGVSLIVTVDNGVAAVEETEYAKSLGMDLVITDHHTPPDVLPDACAVVDLHRSDCKSKFKMLSGVGVAFKLVMALEGEYADIYSLLDNYADLVCIGTIGDIVPLTGENRVFVKRGIELLENSDRIGVRALLKSCGLSGKSLDTSSVSFGLVPRINAAGRLGLSGDCVTLFISEDEELCDDIAKRLNEDNTRRKEIESEILEKINGEIMKNPSVVMDKIIVIDGEGWHQGVIGIVASRIKEIYGKPAIVIARDGESAKGSGRSVKGFSLCDAVFDCKDLLTHCGGHPMAVGLSLKSENIPEFRRRINGEINLPMPYDTLNIDCKLNPAMLDTSLVRLLSYLEPFGSGNTKPVFGLYNMKICDIIPLKDKKYFKLNLSRENSGISVVSFKMSYDEFPYSKGDKVDLAVTLDINEYKGTESLSIILRDVKLSGKENAENIESLRTFEDFCKGRKADPVSLGGIFPQRQDFALVYRYIRDNNGFNYSPENLCQRLKGRISLGKLRVILEALNELGLIEIYEGIKSTEIKYIKTNKKVDLESSKIIGELKEVLA